MKRGPALKLSYFPTLKGGQVGPTVADGIAKLVKNQWTGRLEVFVSVVVVSEANQREHWGAKLARKKKQQAFVAAALIGHPRPPLDTRLKVTLTRDYCGRAKRMDVDNLVGSMKHAQDEVARWLGRDDGDGTVDWVCGQRPGLVAGLAIVIESRTLA